MPPRSRRGWSRRARPRPICGSRSNRRGSGGPSRSRGRHHRPGRSRAWAAQMARIMPARLTSARTGVRSSAKNRRWALAGAPSEQALSRLVAIGARAPRPGRPPAPLVADELQGIDDMVPFVARRDLERLGAALPPGGGGADQLPERHDPVDALGGEPGAGMRRARRGAPGARSSQARNSAAPWPGARPEPCACSCARARTRRRRRRGRRRRGR